MSYTKSIALYTPIAMQIVGASSVVVSSTFDVSAYTLISWSLRWGRLSVTNLTVPAMAYVEGEYVASGNSRWQELDRWTSPLGSSLCTSALSGTNSSAETAITVASGGASFVLDDYIFLQDATITNSEFCRVSGSAPGSTTVNVMDGTINSHAATTSVLWRGAERYNNIIDVRTLNTCRIVCDNALNALSGGSVFEVVINAAY